jgi:carbonic anhydrase
VPGGAPKYAVPFAWESSPTEPLSVARTFLGEVLRDNRAHASQGTKAFLEYREKQQPRATVLACSDSRVHTPAFDATPENDVFMIRNIGNQLGNAEGSVEYGVEHLETPVLLVVGHTGCGAVKAAMGDLSKQSKAVRGELAGMSLAKPPADADEASAWSAAVIDNVHTQVRRSVNRFGQRVQQGKLTVVGAVYDFRNDLGNGAGRLNIVDVNGNDEAERMKAFVEAVSVGALTGATLGSSRPGAGPRAAATGSPQAWSPKDLERALQELDSKQSRKSPH